MPLEFKAPTPLVSEPACDGTGRTRPATDTLLGDRPHDGYRSPLVDALLAQMRQAQASRLRPH